MLNLDHRERMVSAYKGSSWEMDGNHSSRSCDLSLARNVSALGLVNDPLLDTEVCIHMDDRMMCAWA